MWRNHPTESYSNYSGISSSLSSSTYSNFSSQTKWQRISNKSMSREINHSSVCRPYRVPLMEDDSTDRDYTTAQSIVGTCPIMCPEKERIQREGLRDLAIFERLNGNPRKSSSSLAVKKFCRTISLKEIQASDLRPLSVLEDTLDHLMKLLESSDHSFLLLHDFIFDRIRSIRQDISMQNINNDQVICMYQKMVRFYVTSHHKLRRCEGDSTTLSSIHHLNMEQLTKCLGSLYNLYDMNRNFESIFDNEAEFRSLYVLLHLDSQSNSAGESLSLWFSRLSSFIISSKEMCFARTVLRSFRMGNFWRFFHTIASESTYMQFCIIEPFILEVRAHALACINSSGYKLHPYPLRTLSNILMIGELDLESFCNASGLQTSHDDVGNKVLPTKQTGFSHPKGGFQCNVFSWLELLKKDVRQSEFSSASDSC
ncbi:SAC3 family protein C [Bienertia sinuspersici]